LLYTRLSSNIQPKSTSLSRRQILGGMMGLFVAFPWPTKACAATLPLRQSTPPMSTTLVDKDGKPLSLNAFNGMPILINFWATWCPPCVSELPALDRASDELAGEIKILLISVDRGGSKKALPFLQDRGISRPHLAFDSNGALSREMGVRGLPTSFLVTADQRHCWVYQGPREWDDVAVIAELRWLLEDHDSPSIPSSA
jgi:thiol-disulfide isomerase/thioredoxin